MLPNGGSAAATLQETYSVVSKRSPAAPQPLYHVLGPAQSARGASSPTCSALDKRQVGMAPATGHEPDAIPGPDYAEADATPEPGGGHYADPTGLSRSVDCATPDDYAGSAGPAGPTYGFSDVRSGGGGEDDFGTANATEPDYATASSPRGISGGGADVEPSNACSTVEEQQTAQQASAGGGQALYATVEFADDAAGATPLQPTFLGPVGAVVVASPRTEQPIHATGSLVQGTVIDAALPEWMHPEMKSRDEAEAMLRAQPAAPDTLVYLVRPRTTESTAASHALSFVVRKKCIHTKLVQQGSGDFLVNGVKAPRLGTSLEEAVPELVAQTCSKYAYTRAEAVPNGLGHTDA